MLDQLLSAYSRIVQAPPVGGATLCVIAVGAAIGAAHDLELRLVRARRDGGAQPGGSPLSIAVGFASVTLTGWVLMSFATMALSRLVGSSASFEALYCLLAFGMSPIILSECMCPFRNGSPAADRMFRAWSAAVTLVTSASIWVAFSGGLSLPLWKTVIVVLPSAIFVWLVGISHLLGQTKSLLAMRRWHRTSGRAVTLLSSPKCSALNLSEIVADCDDLLSQITKLLKVEPLDFEVLAFLFTDTEAMRKELKKERGHWIGFALSDCIVFSDRNGAGARSIIAHELTHVVAEHRVRGRVFPLLSEGLAEYVAATVLGRPISEPGELLEVSLREMAYSQVFRGPSGDVSEERVTASYAYARSFSHYFIEHYGLSAYLDMYRSTKWSHPSRIGEGFAKQVREVCGIPLEHLERRWRNDVEVRLHKDKRCLVADITSNP